MSTREAGAQQAGRAPLARLARDLVVYGLGDALVKSSALLTMPLYTRAFGPEGYGLWGLAMTTALLAQVALGFGLESAYARYFFQAPPEERPRWAGTALHLVAWPSLVMSAGLALAGWGWARGWGAWPDAGWPLVLAMAGVPLYLVNSMAGQVLRNHFDAVRFSQLNFAAGLLQVLCSVGLGLGLGWGVLGVLAGVALGHLIILPWRLRAVWGDLDWSWDLAKAQVLLRYGLPLVPTSLAFWVFNASDRYVLGWLSTVAETGRYAVAATLAGALALVSSALGQAWSPIATQLFEQNPALARAFYGQLLVYLVATFGALAMGLALFGPELVGLAAAPTFATSALALGPLALSVGAMATTQVTGLGISMKNQTGYFAAYAWAAALVNLVLNLAFVPQGGLLASAWATAATSLLLSLCYAATTQRLWPISYRPWPTLAAALPPLAICASQPWWPALPPVTSWALRLALMLAYPLWLLLHGALGPSEWAALQRRWRQHFPAPEGARLN